MNITGPHIDEHESNAREWQAQERALRDARNGAAPATGDDMALQYRHIADALRQAPPQGLPADFARQLAARVEAGRARRDADARLVRGLAIVMALSGVVALAYYAAPLAAQLLVAVGSQGIGWTLALGACIAMSWGLDWLRRRFAPDMPLHA